MLSLHQRDTGPVFTKSLRLSQILGLNFVSAKFCLKSVFPKGDLAKSKIIKPQWFSVSCDLSFLFKLYYW